MTINERLQILEDREPDLPTLLGPLLRYTRMNAEISQDAMGEQLGYTRQSIGEWESGRKVPVRAVALAWSLLTGVKLSRILDAWTTAWQAQAAKDGRRNPGFGAAKSKTLRREYEADWPTLFPDDKEVTIDLRETGQEHHEGSTAMCRYGEWGVQERGDHAHVGGAVHRREDDDGGVDYRDRNELCERPSQVRDLDFEAA